MEKAVGVNWGFAIEGVGDILSVEGRLNRAPFGV